MTRSGAVFRGISLVTADVPAARRLFADVLGGRATTRDGVEEVWFPPGFAIELVDRAGLATASPLWRDADGAARLTFAVDDSAPIAARLLDAGYRQLADGDGLSLFPPPLLAGIVRLVAPDGLAGPRAGVSSGPVRAVDHVCVATTDLAAALAILARHLGGDVVFGGDNDELGTRSAQVRFSPGVKVELLQPRREGLRLGAFLAAAHPRLHHATFLTDDLPGTIAAVSAAGWSPIDVDLESRPSWREAWLRPGESFGLLLQLVDTPLSYVEALGTCTIEDIVGGRVDSSGYRMTPRPPGETSWR